MPRPDRVLMTDRIIATLRRAPNLSGTQLAGRLGTTYGGVGRALDALERSGVIARAIGESPDQLNRPVVVYRLADREARTA